MDSPTDRARMVQESQKAAIAQLPGEERWASLLMHRPEPRTVPQMARAERCAALMASGGSLIDWGTQESVERARQGCWGVQNLGCASGLQKLFTDTSA